METSERLQVQTEGANEEEKEDVTDLQRTLTDFERRSMDPPTLEGPTTLKDLVTWVPGIAKKPFLWNFT